jgi:predicted RNase H-like HicB family nuclease
MSKAETCTYTVVLDRDIDAGRFVAICPALPGVVTEGETIEETIAMARDAIQGYLASLRKDGLAVPVDEGPIISPVRVELPAV